VNSLEFCRVLQEWKGSLSKFIYADVRLYILCFSSEKEMKEFLSSFKERYILSLNGLETSSVLKLEPGRSLEVYYDRWQYKDIPHMFSLRILDNSIAFYNYQNDRKKYCIQEAVSFNDIYECNVEYGHILKVQDIRNNPNISCCVFYNRTINEEYNVVEYICSGKETVEMCVFEARVIQRAIGERCTKFKENEKEKVNVTYVEIYQEFLSEDQKIKADVELEPRERANLDCCVCGREKEI